MEGKGVLFKRFADVDVFDIEVASEDPEEIIEFCQLIAPTFGGINLEDIRAPECFEIETRLIETLDIPVFHDDQHGTAIISGAALLNALELVGKKLGGREGRLLGRRRLGDRVREALQGPRRRRREHPDGRLEGRDLRGPHRGHEQVQAGVRAPHQRAHALATR